MNRYLTGAVALSLFAGPALAQTTGTPPAAAATNQPTASPEPAKGLTVAKSANFAVRFAAQEPADLMVSALKGVTVYNNQNETLGEIEDFSIKDGRTLTGIVVSVGGVLGLGERYVLIDPSAIVVNRDNGTWRAYINTAKDDLKHAPKFTYNRAKKS